MSGSSAWREEKYAIVDGWDDVCASAIRPWAWRYSKFSQHCVAQPEILNSLTLWRTRRRFQYWFFWTGFSMSFTSCRLHHSCLNRGCLLIAWQTILMKVTVSIISAIASFQRQKWWIYGHPSRLHACKSATQSTSYQSFIRFQLISCLQDVKLRWPFISVPCLVDRQTHRAPIHQTSSWFNSHEFQRHSQGELNGNTTSTYWWVQELSLVIAVVPSKYRLARLSFHFFTSSQQTALNYSLTSNLMAIESGH